MSERRARVVIIGGGFGGLFAALALGDAPADVTLVSAEDHFTFTPMLYEYLSGEVEAWHIAPAYRDLLDERVRFMCGEATDVDFAKREVVLRRATTSRVPYDVLALAVGSVTNYEGVEGAPENSLQFRRVADADALRARMKAALDRITPDTDEETARRAATFAIVGADASGVEIATKMADLLRESFARRKLRGEARVVLIEMGERIVNDMDENLRAHVLEALRQSRINVQTQTKVLRVGADGLLCERDGERKKLKAAAVVWAAGVKINPLIEKLKMEKEEKKHLIVVEPTLQVRGQENIFALGDIARYPNADRELSGTAQLAYQEAGLVAANVRALISGRTLETKHFTDFGKTLSLGTDDAAVEVEGHVVSGALARAARFAAYTARLPTWHYRLRVGTKWLLGGGAPRPL